MRLLPLLLALSALLTLLNQAVAKAEEIALTFDLPDHPVKELTVPAAAPDPSPSVDPVAAGDMALERLPVPDAAANPPSQGAQAPSNRSTGGGDAIALGNPTNLAASLLPPPPPVPEGEAVAISQAAPMEAPIAPAPAPETVPAVSDKPQQPKSDTIALDFGVGPSPAEIAVATAKVNPEKAAAVEAVQPLISIFQGGSESLVARAVGSAEGTRTADGQKTQAYFGHVDPGNGVWNLGTFSYQHEASNPEDADVRQLRRLQAQTNVIQRKAQEHGLDLSLEETLNGIDLANQAPMAALGRGGYVDWLAQARKMGMSGQDAIAYSRTRAFLDPDTQRWNAPGLGNNVHSISRDQERRMLAIARALNAYQAQYPEASQETIAAAVTAVNLAPAQSAETKPTVPALKEAVDSIFDLSLPPANPAPAPATPVAAKPAGLNFAPGLDSPAQPAPATPVDEASRPADSPEAVAPQPVPTAAEAAREGAQNLDPAPAAPLAPASEVTPSTSPEAIAPSASTEPAAAGKPITLGDVPGAVPDAQVIPPAAPQPAAPQPTTDLPMPGFNREGDTQAQTTSSPEGSLHSALPTSELALDDLLFGVDV